MAGMGPDEAQQFYEEDEDPARVIALFDAAEKGRTAPPSDKPSAHRPTSHPPTRHKQRTRDRDSRRALALTMHEIAVIAVRIARSLSELFLPQRH